MFKKWFVLLVFMLSGHAQAYQPGDVLSVKAQALLGIDPEQVTIIDFFAEWCVSCRVELPEVNALAPELASLGVAVLGVDVDEDKALGLAFQKSLGLTFRVVNDTQQTLAEDFEPVGMPALYYVHQGQVLKVRYGAINHIGDVIKADLSSLGLGL